ncbi:MAG: IS200/IS605 family transposase [Deltaproteobacteria bacterium]|nr:IS200/IS605 family transposase [Deltaproteobacteria bacterium]
MHYNEVKKKGSTLTNLQTHIVFSTKNREPMISDSIQHRVYEYMSGVIRGEKCVLLGIGGMSDHVHLLIKIKADLSVSELMKRVKGNTSHWNNENRITPRRFSWQDGFGAFSVSQSQKDAVFSYIANQQEHHRKKTFQEEFIDFLKKQKIEYNEKYLWS